MLGILPVHGMMRGKVGKFSRGEDLAGPDVAVERCCSAITVTIAIFRATLFVAARAAIWFD